MAKADIEHRIVGNPAVLLLGPRQCGKTTLAKEYLKQLPDSLYLDLERPSDQQRLSNPEAFFDVDRHEVLCLDEVQNLPDLFPILRGVIDSQPARRFIILGSASPTLLRQGSESLAGRIALIELGPFSALEIKCLDTAAIFKLVSRGGYPRSYLATDDVESLEWRGDFIRSFVERDVFRLGFTPESTRLERLWRMAATVHGQVLNLSSLGASLGVAHTTVRRYLELLESTFLLRLLPPWEKNEGKRLVRSPKLYIRDSGIACALKHIASPIDLLAHADSGAVWEGFAIENIVSCLPGFRAYFYRTAGGAEIDLVLEKGDRLVAVECKASTAPRVERGFTQARKDLGIEEAYVVAPVLGSYPIEGGLVVAGVEECIRAIEGSLQFKLQ